MKKIILAVITIGLLVSCEKEEIKPAAKELVKCMGCKIRTRTDIKLNN